MPPPPKRTVRLRVESKAIDVTRPEGDAAVVTWLQLVPSHSHVSPSRLVPSKPPNRTALPRALSKDIEARERAEGRKAIIVNDSPMFEVASSLAYMESLMETLEQMTQLGVPTDHVYISSAGKAQGGMALLEALMGHSFKVHGVTATAEWKVAPRTLEIARATAKTLGIEVPLTIEDIVNHAEFVGPGYGRPSEASIEAVKLFARTEGLILDPIYSGKCAAGLLAHIREGRFKTTETVVFVHTGGTPAVFNYPDLWLPAAG